MGKRSTNVEFITELMEWPDTGPLMQAFVLEAIWEYAMQVTTNPPPPDNGFINWESWLACAEEALTKLQARHATTSR